MQKNKMTFTSYNVCDPFDYDKNNTQKRFIRSGDDFTSSLETPTMSITLLSDDTQIINIEADIMS